MTLVLFTRSGCHFCSESMPFYRRLESAAADSGVRLIAATAEDVSANSAYLRSNGIHPENVVSASKNQIRARGTPALILIRNNGLVVDSWLGRLGPDKENDVLKRIRRR